MSKLKKARFWFWLVALALVFALPGASLADHPYQTPQSPYITLTVDGSVTPIINSGDEYHDFTFQGLPDGIGIAPGETGGTVEVYVSHEETTVPFFGTADFQDASVSKLTLDVNSAAVVDASVALPPEAGFLRFCSAFMAGPDQGFSNYTFFANEETSDVVDVPPDAPYGPDPAFTGEQRQGGYSVALNAATGEYTQVAGMGRLNHENTVAVPGGWNQFAMLTTDDTFSATTSQLYMYLANHESHIWQDKGSLWAFRVTRTNDNNPVDATDPFNGANDYLDIQPGDDWQGEFIRVPKEIARGETELPPQDALEQWSNENNVFQFVRLEDLTYDRNNNRVVYVADTGATRVMPDEQTGRMTRGDSSTGLADNGRIFKLVFNENNPRKVDSFSVFADGDRPESSVFVGFTSPDNMDASPNSLMVQEDTDNAEIWRYDFSGQSWQVVASVNDLDGESSGIVDASQWFGEGAWLLDVQAHGFEYVKQEQQGDVLRKLEAGQLMLMVIPGS
jgi:hypothetical protein